MMIITAANNCNKNIEACHLDLDTGGYRETLRGQVRAVLLPYCAIQYGTSVNYGIFP